MTLSERICEYLNGFEGRLCCFLPESLGSDLPSGGVFFQSGVKGTAFYDGSVRLRIPFDLRVRIGGISVREKLECSDFLWGLGAYVRRNPLQAEIEGGLIEGIAVKDGTWRASAYDDGCEEYRLSFEVTVLVESPLVSEGGCLESDGEEMMS